MFKTRVKLNRLDTRKDPDSNVFTLYITYSVHGRRDFVKADALCKTELQQLFSSQTNAQVKALGWADYRCKGLVYAVTLLLCSDIRYSKLCNNE